MRRNYSVTTIDYIDLFCGIGGFRLAVNNASAFHGVSSRCVFSCDVDAECQNAYLENFNERPEGDISKIEPQEIPNHDVLLAGFPCQPFSIIGKMRGFRDTRGTLFFHIARILEAKKPTSFVLENVKLLSGHDKGKTLNTILETLNDLGYYSSYKILNALDFGLPQKRERIFIVGFRKPCDFRWPTGGARMKPLKEILERNVPKKYCASDRIVKSRQKHLRPTSVPTIWHENKAGHVSAHPYSCALRAGASYNYLLVNGKRRLTPREMLRLQGFPENYRIVCNDHQIRKQAGNSLPVPVAEAVLRNVVECVKGIHSGVYEKQKHMSIDGQSFCFEKAVYNRNEKAKVASR